MTVQEAIDALSKLPDRDKELKFMLACPYCGKSEELTGLAKIVSDTEAEWPTKKQQ